MLIVGHNLEQLVDQHRIIDRNAFDTNSLTLTLDPMVKEVRPPTGIEVSYGNEIPAEWISHRRLTDALVLRSGEAVLACSRESLNVPLGYFGFCQTKGSLARLFITVCCADGQIEAGYTGKVTFEMVNFGPLNVRIPIGSKVAQLFIFKTSSKSAQPYSGRYQGATGPTIPLPER